MALPGILLASHWIYDGKDERSLKAMSLYEPRSESGRGTRPLQASPLRGQRTPLRQRPRTVRWHHRNVSRQEVALSEECGLTSLSVPFLKNFFTNRCVFTFRFYLSYCFRFSVATGASEDYLLFSVVPPGTSGSLNPRRGAACLMD